MCLTVDVFQHRADQRNLIIIIVTIKSLSVYLSMRLRLENGLDLISDPHRQSPSETETATPAEGHIHSEWRRNRAQLRPWLCCKAFCDPPCSPSLRCSPTCRTPICHPCSVLNQQILVQSLLCARHSAQGLCDVYVPYCSNGFLVIFFVYVFPLQLDYKFSEGWNRVRGIKQEP